jgi:hypothetical protein
MMGEKEGGEEREEEKREKPREAGSFLPEDGDEGRA